MTECPVCNFINPDTQEICDCGYNFQTRTGGIRPAVPLTTKGSFWVRLLAWTVGLGILGCFVGLCGGTWFTQNLVNPDSLDVYVNTISEITAFFGISGVIAGIVIAIRLAKRALQN